MTEQEKKLLQAKHRAEEAAARNRVKERKARTRRLIQEGAILEKAFPKACDMELEDLSLYLTEKLKKKANGAFREIGAFPFFYPEGRTYSPPMKSAVVLPCGSRALL